MATHQRLAPSAMDRWENCPASIALSDGLPEVDPGPAATEGTRVHRLCERVLEGENYFAVVEREPFDVKAAVDLYVKTIKGDIAKYKVDQDIYPVHIEHQVDLSDHVYPGTGGTMDAALYAPDPRILFVYDYKNGKTEVPVEENPQLLTYALAGVMTLPYCIEFVELVVVQPNGRNKTTPKVKRWRTPSVELVDFYARMKAAAERTDDPTEEPVLGRWCFWCPAKAKCPAQMEEQHKKAVEAFK